MKIAIIGGGIVGSTCAYYLSKENLDVTLFDYGIGQATKASAGIISPWFSKRRNKAWYKMARLGADFYLKLVDDLKKDGYNTNFYKQTGVYLLKKDDSKLEELFGIASERRKESSMIGDLKILSLEEAKQKINSFNNNGRIFFASGGGRLEGERLVTTLINASKVKIVHKKVSLEKENDFYIVDGQKFDKVVLAVGAWLPEILKPLGYKVDVRPQKGQLRDYKIKDENSGQYPVIMPEGELDIIPFENGVVSVGATHENEMGYDLAVDKKQLDEFGKEAQYFLDNLKEAEIINERVGIRAYTSDFSPFYGKIQDEKNIFVASGLGSSGLTTGCIIGYNLAMMLLNKETTLDETQYPVEKYVMRVENY